MEKFQCAVCGGIRTYAWTSARSHAHHLIHYTTACWCFTVTNGMSPSLLKYLPDKSTYFKTSMPVQYFGFYLFIYFFHYLIGALAKVNRKSAPQKKKSIKEKRKQKKTLRCWSN
ncbi:hypothetical protein E2C01_055265 [Portunus trituberculatus]|uniref:Uncharacterized protein n=1 Tax=Portunus trituberculatus TaxID=210409 RepID=A0A5B7GUD1_PORTR|nr:hypothetical protein [Portunus trituberculatus]